MRLGWCPISTELDEWFAKCDDVLTDWVPGVDAANSASPSYWALDRPRAFPVLPASAGTVLVRAERDNTVQVPPGWTVLTAAAIARLYEVDPAVLGVEGS